ncbi:MFS transporter [Streptomyces sp. NPDC056190]|uniref:MFS transporter n=1 Tax=Streptomyces sp. NPDC056190 TaxID=3345741 RepID=UPI0035DE7719
MSHASLPGSSSAPSTEPAARAGQAPPGPSRTPLLAGVLLALFLAAADSTVVGSLLPTMAGQLGQADLYPWLISAFLLTSVLITPLAGFAADRFGGRNSMLAALTAFALASAAVAAATTMPLLIAARAAQGVAGAVAALTYVLIGQAFAPQERARMQALLSAVWGLAAVAGPALGTAAEATVGWRWVFLINVPLAVVAAFLVRRVPAAPAQSPRTLRPLTLLTFAVALGGALLLIEAPVLGLPAVAVVVLAVVTVAALVGHVLQVRRKPDGAVVPVAFAVRGEQRAAALVTIGAAAVLYVTLLPLALAANGTVGDTASGLFVIAGALGWVVGSAVCAGLLQRFGARGAAALGGLLLTAGPLVLVLGGSESLLLAIVGEALAGLGTGFVATTGLVHVQNTSPAQWLGAYTAGITLCRNIGAALGVNLLATVQLVAAERGSGADPAGGSYQAAFVSLAVVGLLTLAGALRLPKRG